MKKLTKEEIIFIAIAGVMILLVGVFLVIWMNREKDYRLLKVCEMDGDGEVVRAEAGTLTPYVNMQLESGDRVKLNTGVLNIKADEDKYIFLEDHTELLLEATGNATNSRTKIELISGGITNDIQKPLSQDSAYEVNTQSATMSVVGTVFYVCAYEEDGVAYTKLSVFSGTVSSRLVYPDGTTSDEEVKVSSGSEILIYQDKDTTDYVSGPQPIKYEELPEQVLRLLGKMADENRDISITKDEVTKILEGPFTVTFMYGDKVFAHQSVKKDGLAEEPSLAPEPEGSWDFNFSTKINKDTVVYWKSK